MAQVDPWTSPRAGQPMLACPAEAQIVRDMADDLSAQNVGVVLNPFDIDNLLCKIDARSGDQAEPG